MNRLAAICLIAMLLVPFWVVWSTLQFEKYTVRKEVKRSIIRGLDREDLVFFAFSEHDVSTQLRWIHSKEFVYQGEYYDIVERSESGDSLYVWCWWDHEETALSRKLEGLTAIALGMCPEKQHQHQIQLDKLKWVPERKESELAAELYDIPDNYFRLFQIETGRLMSPPEGPPPERIHHI